MEVVHPLFTEHNLSFRWHGGHIACCYVGSTEVERGGQSRSIDSRHVAGVDERLVDLALAELRRQVLEHTLTAVEPF